MIKFASALVSISVLAGCASLPQSRPEFQQVVRNGGALTKTDSHVAKRLLEDSVRMLRPRMAECFDYSVSRSRMEGAVVGTSREQWQWSLRLVDKNHAEASVQRMLSGGVKQPEGGLYVLAVDLERIDAASTKLTYYGASTAFGTSAWESMKQWSEGKAAPCPTGIT